MGEVLSSVNCQQHAWFLYNTGVNLPVWFLYVRCNLSNIRQNAPEIFTVAFSTLLYKGMQFLRRSSFCQNWCMH